MVFSWRLVERTPSFSLWPEYRLKVQPFAVIIEVVHQCRYPLVNVVPAKFKLLLKIIFCVTRFYLLVSCDNVFTESVDPHIEDVLLLSEIQYVTRYLHSNDIHILNSWVQPATCTKHN